MKACCLLHLFTLCFCLFVAICYHYSLKLSFIIAMKEARVFSHPEESKVIRILIDYDFPMEIKCFSGTKQQVISKRKNFPYSIDSLGGKILMGKILIKYSITYSKTRFAYHIEIGFLFVPNFISLNTHNDFLSRQNNCDQISYAENRF